MFDSLITRSGKGAGTVTLVAILSIVLNTGPAVAATFVVTSAADSGAGSLRQAVLSANANAAADTITFGPSVTQTITLTSGQITILHDLTIVGPGTQLSISGNDATRLFVVSAGVTARIAGLTLEHGGGVEDGAAVYNSGTLTVTNAVFAQNHAYGINPGFGSGGAIYNFGTLIVVDTVFSENEAGGAGGAIYNYLATMTVTRGVFVDNDAGEDGGAILNTSSATATLNDCDLSGNVALFGGAVQNLGTLTVNRSAFFFNLAFGGGWGGAIVGTSNPGSTVATNSTFFNNGAHRGGAFYGAGTFGNCTFSANTATDYGGAIVALTEVKLRNTILANSKAGGDCFPGTASVIDQGGNMVEDNSCGFSGGVDPGLANGIANNGGPTHTVALLPGSPAIDNGRQLNCILLDTDQRGYPRSVDGDGVGGPRCDSGAYEFASTPPTATPTRTFTPAPSSTPSPPPTSTATSSSTPLPSATSTPTAKSTPTDTPTTKPTLTATPTSTVTPMDTATPTPTRTDTFTPTETVTPTPDDTATETPSPTPTPGEVGTPADAPVCMPAPQAGCRTPVGFNRRLHVSRRKNLVTWRWRTSGDIDVTAFGDPVQTSDYALCVYAGAAPVLVMELDAPAGGTCTGKPCWRFKGSKGFRYLDLDKTPSGISAVVLRTKPAALADIVVRARGDNIPFPLMPLAEPVVVQLVRSDGPQCWQARYTAPALRNNGKVFQDKNEL